jgi:uncharacterized protein
MLPGFIFRDFFGEERNIRFPCYENISDGSDIDLTLFGEQLDLSTLHSIEDELDELFLPYKIDLSLYDPINNPELKKHIETFGIVIFSKLN